LVSLPKWLKDARVLHTDSTVVELGCGITGLLGMLLAENVSTYFLTDQTYVMKALRENVERNSLRTSQNKKSATPGPFNLRLVPLEWETDSAQGLIAGFPTAAGIDLVIVCDCVYNDYLIQPLIQTLVELCTLGSANMVTTVLIAQQLRSDTVFEAFLEALLQRFVVWRVPDANVTPPLRSGSGYVVHLAQLRQDKTHSGSQIV
jgi:predicted nicotinamide N-methyase